MVTWSKFYGYNYSGVRISDQTFPIELNWYPYQRALVKINIEKLISKIIRSHLIMLVCNRLLSMINSFSKNKSTILEKTLRIRFLYLNEICSSLYYFWVQRWLEYIKALETVRAWSNILNHIKYDIRNLSDLKSRLYKSLASLDLTQ